MQTQRQYKSELLINVPVFLGKISIKFLKIIFSFRDAISPYLLRRMKKDVQMVLQLPEKTEQVSLYYLFFACIIFKLNIFKTITALHFIF